MLSHPHRPTHFRHPCYPCHPCHLPHNTHKRRTCHPVTPHYILLHTCCTISLQYYTTVTPSYTSGYTLLHPCRRLFINDVTTFWGDLDSPLPLVFMSCKWSSRKNRPLANDHQERPAPCKWLFGGSGLLQMIIMQIWPLANDHLEGPSSCKWSSRRYGLLQMII